MDVFMDESIAYVKKLWRSFSSNCGGKQNLVTPTLGRGYAPRDVHALLDKGEFLEQLVQPWSLVFIILTLMTFNGNSQQAIGCRSTGSHTHQQKFHTSNLDANGQFGH
jgi:hypothetical protein